ncbi:16S rRNA (uracil(1498)-N(3))-methyltransferase [Amycolatopsis antarctica]|uniref:Ribosomal RNA small subunit methyltransferase E n=1 Tax=Amycolatopsis antarctica TaxID=1854586 RepID=A0A263DA97_9PSEU|nr:16S rRNA (uracil(1498)-N(3))-methyltransferase [Amycolatopsis antarctica]OZM74305.1 16S rRNA (uracil(1498)-N(3))-methyltransferase [Amycolatopsis antarctica]
MADAGETTPPVFLVDALPSGEYALLTGEEARHAATVRRMRAGERLLLGDGAGGLARCTVEAVRPGRDAEIELRVTRRWTDPAPALRVTVVQALAKGDRGELAVELATEAGADAVIPWRAARSVAKWDEGPRGAKALARWRSTVRSAAKQARRSRVPEVAEPLSTAELAGRVRRATAALVLDAAAGPGLAAVHLPAEGELLLVVGPEGGIAPEEAGLLAEAGATAVRLGPDVLRTSTAAAVTLGALGVLTGRWDRGEST